MHSKPLESDWKVFRERVLEWRERYLETRNAELVRILTDDRRTPTERFWEVKKCLDEDAKLLRDLLDGHSRSKMEWFLILMCGHGFIGEADLDEFSDGLRERIQKWSAPLGE
jgi:hypothetical protein